MFIHLTPSWWKAYNRSIFHIFMNSPSERRSSPERTSQDFLMLSQAAQMLHLTPEEFAQFWFYKPGTMVFMSVDGQAPVESGFYGPSELLGAYRPDVRLLRSEVASVPPDEVEAFLKKIEKTQRTDPTKTASGRIRDALKRLF